MTQDLGTIAALRRAKNRLAIFAQANAELKKFGGGLTSNTLDDLERLYHKLDNLIKQTEKKLKDIKPDD